MTDEDALSLRKVNDAPDVGCPLERHHERRGPVLVLLHEDHAKRGHRIEPTPRSMKHVAAPIGVLTRMLWPYRTTDVRLVCWECDRDADENGGGWRGVYFGSHEYEANLICICPACWEAHYAKRRS